ncbi:MAG: hypothetical protein ACHQ1H_08145, partial [Nitrososphaerales archaeon]
LSTFRPIVLFELQNRTLRHQGSSSSQVLSYFTSMGYSTFSFGDDMNLVPLSETSRPSLDLVAIPG